MRERARAALWGVAIGDALGATLEFLTRPEIRARHGVLRDIKGGGWLDLAPGQITDDTQMSLCIARSIAEVGFAPKDIADRFVAWMRSKPIDMGNTCRRGIRRYMMDGSVEGLPNEGDGGNGAAMRVVPVALASLGDPALFEQWAIAQAHITHHHALSDAATILVGKLVHLGCTGAPRDQLRLAADALVLRFPTFGFTPYRGLATTYVVDTLQTVLHCFFETHSFEECLIATVNQGGDADTTGAIAGGIAGAFYGAGEIPRRWMKKLDRNLVQELSSLSDRLVDRAPVMAEEVAPIAELAEENLDSTGAPASARLRVAVASRDGKTVHQHFGRATQFLIFDVEGGVARFRETRANQPACRGGQAVEEEVAHDPATMQETVECVSDCDAVLVAAIGPGAREKLEARGVRAYVMPEFIDSALARLVAGLLTGAHA